MDKTRERRTIMSMNTQAIISLATPHDIYLLEKEEYFVAGLELAGGRHYSPSVPWEEACKLYDEYIAMINYFGGGIVELYEKRYDDYYIVSSTVCIDMD